MLFRLFKLPPLVYFIVSPLLLAAGIFVAYASYTTDMERKAALSHAAPEEVGIEAIASGETSNDYDEVVVRAQGNVDFMVETVRTKRGRERSRKLFMPLYPVDATDFSAPAKAVMEIDGIVSDEQLLQLVADEGQAGMVFVLNGRLEAGGNSDASQAMAGKAALEPAFVTVNVFPNGREAALRSSDSHMFVLILGLVLAMLVAGYGWLRKRKLDKDQLAYEQQYEET
ncbi:hypothetical protein ACR9YC_09055 [Parasphingorhabdus sp. DH2-15]|uniref:hypothetical protein n=1 Tax=Parasphingorhabdus sp. DH2-15 TaxID=3444112 RepID=UPI003F68850F